MSFYYTFSSLLVMYLSSQLDFEPLGEGMTTVLIFLSVSVQKTQKTPAPLGAPHPWSNLSVLSRAPLSPLPQVQPPQLQFLIQPQRAWAGLQSPVTGEPWRLQEHSYGSKKGRPWESSTMAGRHPRQMAWGTNLCKNFTNLPCLPLGATGGSPLTTTISL